MLIHHYSKKYEAIEQDGVIKREMDIGQHDDGFNLNCVWLTASNKIAGASHSMNLNVIAFWADLCEQLGRSPTVVEFEEVWHRSVARSDRINNNISRCYTFRSEDIGAVWWNAYKRKWAGESVKKRKWIRELDDKSQFNGDNLDDYWITTNPIPIAAAVAVSDHFLDYNTWLNDRGYSNIRDAFADLNPKFQKRFAYIM